MNRIALYRMPEASGSPWAFCDTLRAVLAQATPGSDDWVGLLASDFGDITGMSEAQILQQVQAAAAAPADVALFGAWPDAAALYLNVFEHAETVDPGVTAACQLWLDSVAAGCPPLSHWVMDTRQTVWGHRLVARTAFWREWLRWADSLRQSVEHGPAPTRQALIGGSESAENATRLRLIVEGLSSLILTVQPHWRSWPVNPFPMRWANPPLQPQLERAVAGDALKRAYRDLGFSCYLEAYARLRARSAATGAAPAERPTEACPA